MTRRRGLFAAAVLGFALAAATAWALAAVDVRATAAPAAVRAAAAPVVGEVTSLTAGGRRLRVTPAGGGRKTSLRKGSELRRGDVVDVGAGVKATILLTRPAGVPADTELVFVRSSDGRERDIALKAKGSRQTIVTIG